MENKTSSVKNIDKILDYLEKPKNIVLIIVLFTLFIQINIVIYNLFTGKIVLKAPVITPSTVQVIAPSGSNIADVINNQPAPSTVSAGNKTTTYACDPSGICNSYKNPKGQSQCPIIFSDNNCSNKCGDVINRCKE